MSRFHDRWRRLAALSLAPTHPASVIPEPPLHLAAYVRRPVSRPIISWPIAAAATVALNAMALLMLPEAWSTLSSARGEAWSWFAHLPSLPTLPHMRFDPAQDHP